MAYKQISPQPVIEGGTGSTSFTSGSVVFSNGTILTEDNTNVFWDDTNNRLGIGTATPSDTLQVLGNVDVFHTSAEADDHALEIDCDAAGFGDVKALDIFYTTGAITAVQDEEGILLNIDESASLGGIFNGYEVLTTSEGSAIINGYTTGINVNPIVHESGTFGNADNILNKAVDVTAALASGGAGNISIFVADNDTITVGDAATWDEMEIILDTGASGSGVAPTFEYSTGGAAYSAFSPADGTNGFRNTGAILWDSSVLAGWATATSGNYEIKITRTRNSLSTTPIIDKLQISSVTEYKWDKNGDVNLNSLTLATPLSVANGGTGLTTISDAAILVGDGTNAIESIGPLTNGQLLVGSTGVSPVAASLTQPAAGLTITGGAGSITFALADSLAALEGLTGNGVVVKTGADTFTERTITGTSSRITVTNGNGVSGNPTVDISASYVGQTSITTLGTVTTGTWNGTAISETNGGTNQTTYATGDLLYASGANTLSKLAIGSSTQVLTVTGGVPVWAAASGGGGGDFVFISSATISSDATIDFTDLSSTYSAYFFVLDAITPATDGVRFYMRVSTDNGSTFESGASDYSWRSIERINSSSGGGSVGDNEMRLANQPVGSDTNEDLTGYVYCFNPSNTKFTTVLSDCYFITDTGAQVFNMMGGQYSSTTAVDAVQFFFESGNLESGKISMYGIEAS